MYNLLLPIYKKNNIYILNTFWDADILKIPLKIRIIKKILKKNNFKNSHINDSTRILFFSFYSFQSFLPKVYCFIIILLTFMFICRMSLYGLLTSLLMTLTALVV